MTASVGSVPASSPAPSFTRKVFSDPTMRPALEAFYTSRYEPLRERVADMKAAEQAGEAPRTIRSADGRVATELGAAAYEAMIPSFEKWLDMQSHFSVFDAVDHFSRGAELARADLEETLQSLHPDRSSGVRLVISDEDRILGYLDEHGVATHRGGEVLERIWREALKKNLTGEARVAYVKNRAAAEISSLTITDYGDHSPSRREFAARWYPHHDVDASHEMAVAEARALLEQKEAQYQQQMANLHDMRSFLLASQEEAAA